ncbi:MAG: HipA family kinase [Chloroflexota bacterium]
MTRGHDPVARLAAVRYAVPLREGGSLPAVVETADGDEWVVKFRGAGQGPGALVAELVAGSIGHRLGLPIPDLAVVEVPPGWGAPSPTQRSRSSSSGARVPTPACGSCEAPCPTARARTAGRRQSWRRTWSGSTPS